MKHTLWRVALGASVGLLATAALGQTSFSDSFNSETLGLNYTGFANWTVSDGSVDVIGIGFYDLHPGNGYYVDLDGTTSDSGVLKTNFDVMAGYTYTVSFKLGGSMRGDTNTVHVELDGYAEDFTLASGDPLATVVRTVSVASAGSRLSFENGGGDNLGAILDDVNIRAVPEPATLAVLGLGALGLIRRRR